MNKFPAAFGLPAGGEGEALAARIAFLLTGVWWIGFAQITFRALPDNVYQRPPSTQLLKHGYYELLKVWRSLRQLPVLRNFLVAFFFYNTGVQTVMYLAALFGDKELKLPASSLILTILIIQIVAIAGSYLFAFVSKLRGNKSSLMIMVLIWIGICVGAFFVHNAMEFYVLAFVVGIVMGGIQSLSRATYSKLIPANTIDHASYFSFYDVTDKLSLVLGTSAYGAIEAITGSMRNSTLALGLFFIVGLGFLFLLRVPITNDKKYEEKFSEHMAVHN